MPRRPLVLAGLLALLVAGCGSAGDGRRDAATPAPAVTRPAPEPQTRPIVGIGEQGAAMFAAPAFRALGLTHARLVVPFDALDRASERPIVDGWLQAARSAGVEPFVTFGHSRSRPEALPTAREFRRVVRAFRTRYPQVQVFAPWNEINHASQPTHDAPRRAAEFFDVLREECDGCTVLAGDLLDQRGMTEYLAEYRRALKAEPELWGLHNYADANRFRRSGLDDLLGAVEGDVWLTETGGLVEFGRSFPRDEQRAAKALRHVLDLAREEPRVARVYLYNWTGTEPGARFDSGLVDPDGTPRPAYGALLDER